MTPETLIVLSPGFPGDESESTCLPAQQMFLRKLKQLHPGMRIIVCAFQYPFVKKEYDWFGIEVISFDGRNRGKLYRRLLWWRILKRLAPVMTHGNIVGILSFWLGDCALVGRRLSDRYHTRHLTWLLGQDVKKGNKYFYSVKPGADQLVAISDFTSDQLFENYGVQPSFIIPIGIDPEEFPTDEYKRSVDVLGVGSLIALKRFELFIDIVASLKKKHPSLKAVICGKGPEKERLVQKIQSCGLGETIRLMDEIPHDKVLELMKKSKLLLHTSEYESFSSVSYEALYAGCSVVSFVKPMKNPLEHFYYVENKDVAVDAITDILTKESNYTAVSPYMAKDAAKRMMEVLRNQEIAR